MTTTIKAAETVDLQTELARLYAALPALNAARQEAQARFDEARVYVGEIERELDWRSRQLAPQQVAP